MPSAGRGVGVWSSPSWQAEVIVWVDERLAERGMCRTGEWTIRVRAWAAVMRVPTDQGPVWLKAASQATGAEIGLYGLLNAVVPERVLRPIAVDVSRGWILLPDGGGSLEDALNGVDLAALLERILPQYGELQLALAPHIEQLISLGLDDMRPARALQRFDEAAAAVGRTLGPGDEPRYARALAHRERFAGWAEGLAESRVPHSIDHNDLHSANVLLPGADIAVPARFYDWGDSVLAHPFATMLHGLGWVAARLGVHQEDARIRRLRDAYLEPFSNFGSRAELAQTLELACRVAKAARCLSWARAIELGDEARGFELAPLELFVSIPDDSYLSPI
jgi:hypothetical protein